MLGRLTGSKHRHGSATVEFALTLPLLFLLCMGTTDFGRLFYNAVTVANAAGTGAFYGTRNNIYATDRAGMEAAARNDAKNLQSVTATADFFCDCPNNPGPSSGVNCITGTCGTYGYPRLYVRTNVRQTFETIGPYPGIPSSTVVGRDGFMRVQ